MRDKSAERRLPGGGSLSRLNSVERRVERILRLSDRCVVGNRGASNYVLSDTRMATENIFDVPSGDPGLSRMRSTRNEVWERRWNAEIARFEETPVRRRVVVCARDRVRITVRGVRADRCPDRRSLLSISNRGDLLGYR